MTLKGKEKPLKLAISGSARVEKDLTRSKKYTPPI